MHLGEEKVLLQLKERFSWPGYTKAELHTIQTGYPMQIVCVNIRDPYQKHMMVECFGGC